MKIVFLWQRANVRLINRELVTLSDLISRFSCLLVTTNLTQHGTRHFLKNTVSPPFWEDYGPSGNRYETSLVKLDIQRSTYKSIIHYSLSRLLAIALQKFNVFLLCRRQKLHNEISPDDYSIREDNLHVLQFRVSEWLNGRHHCLRTDHWQYKNHSSYASIRMFR